MKSMLLAPAVIGLLLAAGAPASAGSGQLAAAAGLTPAEAAGMSLAQIAAHKFNRDAGRDGQQTVTAPASPVAVDARRHAQLIASAHLSPDEAQGLDLDELVAAKYNGDVSAADRQVIKSSRGSAEAGRQLIAAAGLTPAEARGMSLTEIAAHKFNRDARRDDAQTVAD